MDEKVFRKCIQAFIVEKQKAKLDCDKNNF